VIGDRWIIKEVIAFQLMNSAYWDEIKEKRLLNTRRIPKLDVPKPPAPRLEDVEAQMAVLQKQLEELKSQ
jgi:hypothetical protein